VPSSTSAPRRSGILRSRAPIERRSARETPPAALPAGT
jgi:hypothetical protein